MASCPMTAKNSAALASLMSDNPRYAEMFDVNTQSANTGIDIDMDYTDAMNALRDKAAVQHGSLRKLLGVEEQEFSPVKRERVTFFSYRACEIGFRENLIFSSEGYKESPGVASIGPTILAMVGKEHKRLRSAAQPLFKRPKVLNWWNKRWVQDTADALLDRLLIASSPALTWWLGARRRPACNWPRLLLDDELLECGTELAFSPVEIQQLLSHAPGHSVDSVLQFSAGWCAGVRIALLGDGHPDKTLLDYLQHELFSTLPPELSRPNNRNRPQMLHDARLTERNDTPSNT